MINKEITKNEFKEFKEELFQEIQNIIGKEPKIKKWLKSSEVKEILGCSDSTLQNLRGDGTLIFSRVGGTVYYPHEGIVKLFESGLENTEVDIIITEDTDNE